MFVLNCNQSSPVSTKAKEPVSVESFSSDDGRYTIFMNPDLTGYVQIVEYAGSAPRQEASKVSVPFEFLASLMDKMLFNSTSTGAIVLEPDLSVVPSAA